MENVPQTRIRELNWCCKAVSPGLESEICAGKLWALSSWTVGSSSLPGEFSAADTFNFQFKRSSRVHFKYSMPFQSIFGEYCLFQFRQTFCFVNNLFDPFFFLSMIFIFHRCLCRHMLPGIDTWVYAIRKNRTDNTQFLAWHNLRFRSFSNLTDHEPINDRKSIIFFVSLYSVASGSFLFFWFRC